MSSNKRIGIAGLQIIKDSESLRLKAYLCPAGIPTIGYGHTKGVKLGDTCTVEQAEAYLINDCEVVENDVNDLFPNCNQNQFDALCSWIFNLGRPKFVSSTLYRVIRQNAKRKDIEAQWSRWTKAVVNGELVSLPGLVTRRKKESDLYFTPIA